VSPVSFAAAPRRLAPVAIIAFFVGRRVRDFMSSRVRNPFRSSARRWSFTPFVLRMPMKLPISRSVGG
jgi:hypothetical protein